MALMLMELVSKFSSLVTSLSLVALPLVHPVSQRPYSAEILASAPQKTLFASSSNSVAKSQQSVLQGTQRMIGQEASVTLNSLTLHQLQRQLKNLMGMTSKEEQYVLISQQKNREVADLEVAVEVALVEAVVAAALEVAAAVALVVAEVVALVAAVAVVSEVAVAMEDLVVAEVVALAEDAEAVVASAEDAEVVVALMQIKTPTKVALWASKERKCPYEGMGSFIWNRNKGCK